MNLTRNGLIVLISVIFVAGAGTAYAGIVLPTITLAGNVSITGDLSCPGCVGSADVDSSEVQERVTSSCPSGEYIRVISEDGTVICESPAGAGSTSVLLFTTGAEQLPDLSNISVDFIVGQGNFVACVVSCTNAVYTSPIIPRDGTVKNLIVDMPVTSGGQIFTEANVIVFKNLFTPGTQGTLLSCSISDGQRSCQDNNQASVERGDRIVVSIRSQGTLPTSAQISMEFS